MWPAGVSPPLARDLCRPSAVRGRAWPACGSTSTLTQTRPLAVALRCAVHAVCCLLCRSSHACRSLLKADRCTAALRHVYRSCAQSNPTQPAVSATAHRGLRTVGQALWDRHCGVRWVLAYCSTTGTGRRKSRAEISRVQADVGYLDSVLQHGGIKAAEVAHTSMQRVLQLTGLRAS